MSRGFAPRGAPRGRGGFGDRGGRGGAGRGSFRGGRGGYQDQGPPAEVLGAFHCIALHSQCTMSCWRAHTVVVFLKEMGTFMHAAEGEMVCASTNAAKVPYFNAPIYLQNKSSIGKVDEILGPINEVYFTIKPSDGVQAASFAKGDKVFIGGDKLLPLERFLPKPKGPPGPKAPKKKRGAAGGPPGRGGARGGFGGRGGRGAPRGRG